MKKKIIIADICSINHNGKSTGHYFPVAQNYMDMFGADQVLVAGGPIYHDKFTQNHLPLPFDHTDGLNPLKAKWQELMNCRSLFKQAKGQIIVLQSVAIITSFIAILLFYRKESKLYMIQYYTEPLRSKCSRFLYHLIKHKIDGIICSSERVGRAYSIPYFVITDYVYTGDYQGHSNDLITKEYNDKIYDFCLVGVIGRDKGQVQALKALANQGYKIVIAGKTTDQTLIKELNDISSLDPTIEMHIGYVSDEDYYKYIRNSRYCILNYSGTYNDRSSGVVLDIIFNNTPVVGNNCGALKLIEKNKLGKIYDNINTFNPSEVLNVDTYREYLINIKNYLNNQRLSIQELKSFLQA